MSSAMWPPEQDETVRTQGMWAGKSFPTLLVIAPAWARCLILDTIPDKNVAQPGLEQEAGIHLTSPGEEKAKGVPNLFSGH